MHPWWNCVVFSVGGLLSVRTCGPHEDHVSFIYGTFKNKVYASNPHTVNELKDNIISAIESISAEELLRVNNNFIRCQQCVRNSGFSVPDVS